MASQQVVDRSVEELEKEITCAICRDLYKEPKVLPCCHYYCKECVLKLSLRSIRGEPFSCPECRVDTVLPNGNVDLLPTAFFINRMKDVYFKLKKTQQEAVRLCEMCERGNVTAYCQECAQYICDKCVEAHKRMKVFLGHNLTSGSGQEGGGALKVSGSTSLRCEEHQQPISLFCFDCDTLICRDCTITIHSNHKTEFIAKAASVVKKNLAEELKPLQQLVANLSGAVDGIRETKTGLELQGNAVASKIKTSFEELHKVLDEWKDQLLNESSSLFHQKLELLATRENSVSESMATALRVVEYTQQCLHHLTDCEIMHIHADVHRQIHRVREEESKKGAHLEPSEELNIEVEVCSVQDLQQLCQEQSKVSVLPVDPSKCTVTGVGGHIELHSPAVFTLTTKLSNGKITKQGSVVDCYLKSIVDGSVNRCEVSQTKSGEYQIHCLPGMRGQNQLTIKVNEQEIVGSPFNLGVLSPPKELGEPVKVLNDLQTPHSVAVNSVGEIVVTEWGTGGGAALYTPNGRLLRRIKRPECKFERPTGVAIDKKDNVYIADKSNWIFKFSKSMDLIDKVKHTSVSPNLYGIAVIEGEVMVSEKNRHVITVYNTQLQFCRRVEVYGGLTGIYDISGDEHGNLYLSHQGDCRVHILDKAGKHLQSFGTLVQNDGRSSLSGICVAGPYIYVANETENKVGVYTTAGEFVSSFGGWGNNEGDFYSPCGVCVQDGYVYVCDRFNNRVQIF